MVCELFLSKSVTKEIIITGCAQRKRKWEVRSCMCRVERGSGRTGTRTPRGKEKESRERNRDTEENTSSGVGRISFTGWSLGKLKEESQQKTREKRNVGREGPVVVPTEMRRVKRQVTRAARRRPADPSDRTT